MTGFALGESPLGEGRLVLEVRSLNHRFLEVRVRVPQDIADQAFFLEQLARERLERGRYDIGVRLEGPALAGAQLDVSRARAVHAALLALRDELAPGSEVPLSAVLAVPNVVSTTPAARAEDVQRALRGALDRALERLFEMRRTEGAALKREIAAHLERARVCRDAIAERAKDVVVSYRSRLKERLARLLGDASLPVDPGRLETELAILADRSDITEEVARLSSHFDQLKSLLEEDAAVGRRIDFLLQEIAREANTVGAKSQDAELAHLVVELKAATERMREQVQNVQ
jgi:uncharacterized protein (TIGR00255 family)